MSAAFSFTLTESATTMTYGGPSPTFRGVLDIPSDDPPLSGANPPVLHTAASNYIPSVTGTGPYDLYWSGIDPTSLSVGAQTVYAIYQSPLHGAMNSNVVTLTVLKTTPTIQCLFKSSVTGTTFAIGAPYPLQVGSQFAGDNFSVTFTGAQTFTSGPIVADASGSVVATVPNVPGIYNTNCIFDGSPTMNPASYSMGQTVASLNKQPGGIALYVSPTPVTSNAPTTWMVVLSGQPGYPAPTGGINLFIGGSATRGGLVLTGGTVTFTATAPPVQPTDHIHVAYYGDTVYSALGADFPLNPPPIPAASPSPAPPPSQSVAPSSAPATQSPPAMSPSPSQPPASPVPGAGAPSPNAAIAHQVAATARPRVTNNLVYYVLASAAAVLVLSTAGWLAWRRRTLNR